MHFFKLLPLAAFAALAAAQADEFLAQLSNDNGDTLIIPLESSANCVDLEETAPKYDLMNTGLAAECFLFGSLDCVDQLQGGYEGGQLYDISEYDFKSVYCYQ